MTRLRSNKLLIFLFILLFISTGTLFILPPKPTSKNLITIWRPLGAKDILCVDDKCFKSHQANVHDSDGEDITESTLTFISKKFYFIPIKITTIYWKSDYMDDFPINNFIFDNNFLMFTTGSSVDGGSKIYSLNLKQNTIISLSLPSLNYLILSANSKNKLILLSLASNTFSKDNTITRRSDKLNQLVINTENGQLEKVGYYNKFNWINDDAYQLSITNKCYLSNPTIIDCQFGKHDIRCGDDNLKFLISYYSDISSKSASESDWLMIDDKDVKSIVLHYRKQGNYIYQSFDITNFMSCEKEKKFDEFYDKKEVIDIFGYTGYLFQNKYQSTPTIRDQTNIAVAYVDLPNRRYTWYLSYSPGKAGYDSRILLSDWNHSIIDFKEFLQSIHFYSSL